ncbi:MAG: cbb3-type cytochrome c oxidase subunit II [Verrucomicrobiota bacterium]
MKTGVSIFIATSVALGASWCGFVLAPLLQLGGAQQTVILQSTDNWPVQRTGEATLGLQIYRANGCAACHTEQVRQTGVTSVITLTGLGVYKADDFAAFAKSLFVLPELSAYTNALAQSLDVWKGELPKSFLVSENQAIISEMADRLKAVGVKSETHIVATGADIARGWGVRQSVAVDYLYDQPVQLGSLRAGPDLANIGVRAPDANWQLTHLYAPKAVVPDSTMPSFKFLFEVRKVGAAPSPDALNLPKEFAAAAGFEIVPKPEAKQLAAYLLSLKANVPLYEAPFTPVTAAK